MNPRDQNLIRTVPVLSKRILQTILVAFAIVFFSSSIKNIFQVFFVSMAESFDQTRGGFAVSASVFMVVFGIASPVVGFLADHVGPKRVLIGGLQAAGIALLGGAILSNYWSFVLFYGVVASFALAAMTYVPTGILVGQSVPKKYTGIAYATLTSGAAIGFILLSPAWVFAQEYFHWRQVFFVAGLTFLLPLQILAIQYLPDAQSKQSNPASKLATMSELRDIFTSQTFLALSISFFGCGVTMAFVDIHMIAHFQDIFLTPPQIAVVMMVFGVSELISGFVAGWFCDRFPKEYVIAAFYGLRSVSLLLLATMPNLSGVIMFSILFGLSYMGTVIGTSTYTLSAFAKTNRGLAFGFIWMIHQLGAFASTQLGANSFDIFGDYHLVIMIVGVVSTLSMVISLVILPPTPRKFLEKR